MSKEEYREIENLYSDVKEWLKFAESKNAALLTFNVAVSFWIIRLFILNGPFEGSCYIMFAMELLIVSIVVNLISFVPVSIKNKKAKEVNFKYNNLLYYSNIAKLNIKLTRNYLSRKYYNKNIDEPYFADLTEQIYSLSVITRRKNTYFKVSLIITIMSFVLLTTHLVVY